MAKADRILNFVLLSINTRSEHHNKGGTIRGRRGTGMAAIFSLGGPFILLRTGVTDFEGGPSMA